MCLFLPMGFILSYAICCLVSFHLKLKNSLYHFLQDIFTGAKLDRFLFSWESSYLSFTFERQFCWVQYSWLAIFFFQRFECIISLPLGLQCVCSEICWLPYGDFLFCDNPLFSHCLQNSLSLTFDILIIMYLGISHFVLILGRILWVSWNWIAISFLRFWKFSVIVSLNKLSPLSLSCLTTGTPITCIYRSAYSVT